MKKFLSDKKVQFILRVLLGALFIYAAAGKIADPSAFARVIHNYRFLPDALLNISAIIIPWVELISGIFMLAGIFKRGSSLLILTLLVIFTIALIQAYFRGLDIACGCFNLDTTGDKSDILIAFIRDIILIIFALILFKYSDNNTIKNLSNEEFHTVESR